MGVQTCLSFLNNIITLAQFSSDVGVFKISTELKIKSNVFKFISEQFIPFKHLSGPDIIAMSQLGWQIDYMDIFQPDQVTALRTIKIRCLITSGYPIWTFITPTPSIIYVSHIPIHNYTQRLICIYMLLLPKCPRGRDVYSTPLMLTQKQSL